MALRGTCMETDLALKVGDRVISNNGDDDTGIVMDITTAGYYVGWDSGVSTHVDVCDIRPTNTQSSGGVTYVRSACGEWEAT